jgi:hypothetical protein
MELFMAYVKLVFEPCAWVNNCHARSFGSKAAGPLPSSSTEIKNAWSLISIILFEFMGWYVKQGRLLLMHLVINVQWNLWLCFHQRIKLWNPSRMEVTLFRGSFLYWLCLFIIEIHLPLLCQDVNWQDVKHYRTVFLSCYELDPVTPAPIQNYFLDISYASVDGDWTVSIFTETENRGYTPNHRAGFGTAIPVFERPKTKSASTTTMFYFTYYHTITNVEAHLF